MERMRRGLVLTLLAGLLFPSSFLNAGTRFIPPPPPRQQGDDENIQQESYWGSFSEQQAPGQLQNNRWSTLQDDEGREIDFNESAPVQRTHSRSPASLETAGVAAKENRPTLRRTKTKPDAAEETMQKLNNDSNDPMVRRKGVQEVAVIASESGFYPKTFFVSRDVPVRLFVTGASKGSLCLMMDSFNVRKQVRANKIEEISFTPNQPGTYRFYCPVNGGEGTMVVKELTTAVTTNE